MSTHSTDGRPWASLSALKPGDVLIADGGFTCIRANSRKMVTSEKPPIRRFIDWIISSPAYNHDLFVICDDSKHFHAGQLSEVDHDSLVGFWNAK
jgi:hypothetical protein